MPEELHTCEICQITAEDVFLTLGFYLCFDCLWGKPRPQRCILCDNFSPFVGAPWEVICDTCTEAREIEAAPKKPVQPSLIPKPSFIPRHSPD